MGFEKLTIKHSYISRGEDNITDSLIAPALNYAVIYKRTAAYFSSSVFDKIANDIISLVKREGKIQLICGPELQKNDYEAIKSGYKVKEESDEEDFLIAFKQELKKFDDKNLALLFELVSKGYLSIKVAYSKGEGIYHDKLGILKDENNHTIVFYGSANSTGSAYYSNYEKIRVITNLNDKYNDEIDEEEREFDKMWQNENDFLNVKEFNSCAIEVISKTIEQRKLNSSKHEIVLRDYQNDAISAWVKNNYHGFFVMATGTGKTWTAIYAAKELMKTRECILVICAPYKHLVKQWAEDIEKVFLDAHIVLVSSDNPTWTTQLNEEIIRQQYKKTQLIVISTIKSFQMVKFNEIINKTNCEKMLIVDEAHRFTVLDEDIKNNQFQYLLGLSATPGNGKNQDFVDKLLEFFGGKVFDLTIEDALQRKFLVPYNYYPIFVNATEEEEKDFHKYSSIMASCYINGVLVDKEKFVTAYRSRLRVIGMAKEKETKISYILKQVKEKNHFVVYCGDGRIFDSSTKEELRHIQFIKRKLNELGYKPSQFTATENMNKRMELVDGFNKGEFDSLVAIRCLDEGINIPSIKGALILSSNDDYREFVQRRGRILRLYSNKEYANIYDVIVLPNFDEKDFAVIELKRFYEYARLSMNKTNNMKILKEKVTNYNIDLEELSVFEGMEEEIDE